VANSLRDEALTFAFARCGGPELTLTARVLVNLAPAPYDLDVGREGPVLALSTQGSGEFSQHASRFYSRLHTSSKRGIHVETRNISPL